MLACLLRQWDGITPFPGTRSVTRAEENPGGMDLTLTGEEDATIRKAAGSLKKVSDRYPTAPGAIRALTLLSCKLAG